MKLRKKDESRDISYELKIRGIHQDITTEKCLAYEEFVKKVKNYGKEDTVRFFTNQFMPRIKEGNVYSKMVVKNYDVVLPKVWLLSFLKRNLGYY